MNGKLTAKLSGWGLYPTAECRLSRPESISSLTVDAPSTIARGLGRSYNDAALNGVGHVVLMERLNKFLAFDSRTGVLRAEAGLTLKELLEVTVPRGWFIPVTPGTNRVTLGGCVAADIHGKNHHRDGSFSRCVLELTLMLADGSTLVCSPWIEPEVFWATVGGMGLTGFITEVVLQLTAVETAYISVKHTAADSYDKLMEILGDPKEEDHFSVAWVDCLARGDHFGRGVVMNGHYASEKEIPFRGNLLELPKRKVFAVPFGLPSGALLPSAVRAFNALYYKLQGRKKEPFIVDYERYFYPLDALEGWNHLYGRKGFVQYQFVIPSKDAREGTAAILRLLAANKCSPFLAVLKRFGAAGPGYLSFPAEGYTAALDMPLAYKGLFAVLDKCDEIVLKFGGRLYLAKDARMKPATFRSMYPRFTEWQNIKGRIDPHAKFSSDLSARLQMGGGR